MPLNMCFRTMNKNYLLKIDVTLLKIYIIKKALNNTKQKHHKCPLTEMDK